ncbi:hypothetical protein FJR48_01150 [Sulfurimonas lithotrophica]|uniref:Uncharacterized protein n=1 Tax=Sulfurimonas lithotrophica TaxID=2590022 RepID=A0A5P8NYA0_9BACT|nr:hypothetical protein [Sulfurimonas lithotrophica]QFR48401.1 hypothetical protein FJR48_01150 [Sulfurimonas lithotrophica]
MSKKEKFISLAESRMQKALHMIHLVGNLSNKNNYEYTDKEVKKIITSLEDAVKNVKKRFESSSKDDMFDFKF